MTDIGNHPVTICQAGYAHGIVVAAVKGTTRNYSLATQYSGSSDIQCIKRLAQAKIIQAFRDLAYKGDSDQDKACYRSHAEYFIFSPELVPWCDDAGLSHIDVRKKAKAIMDGEDLRCDNVESERVKAYRAKKKLLRKVW